MLDEQTFSISGLVRINLVRSLKTWIEPFFSWLERGPGRQHGEHACDAASAPASRTWSLKAMGHDSGAKAAKARSAKAVRSSEDHLRTIIDAEPECIKLLAADCTVLEMNPAGLTMIEAESVDQVIGRSVLGLIHPEYRAEFQRLTNQVFQLLEKPFTKDDLLNKVREVIDNSTMGTYS